jgi:hypothetical protein
METGKHCPGTLTKGLFEEETEQSTKKSASAKKRKAVLGFVLINQLQHFLKEKPLSSTISRQRSRT